MKLVTVAEMRAIEKEADASGLTYELMMEHAGRGLAQAVIDAYPDLEDRSALGLVGSGNNGGDTLVALAHLAQRGWSAAAYLARPRPAEDALIARLEQAGGKIYRCQEDPGYRILAELIGAHALLMDGVLGTGVRLPLHGELAQVLESARQAVLSSRERPRVVAVDCPSGVDCDSGQAAEQCIPADLTVTMAAVKTGLLNFPAYQLCGDIQVAGIGLPQDGGDLKAWAAVQRQVANAEMVRAWLPERPAEAHKGTFGTALVVAGSLNFTGAALLAGEAAYRIGAGLVTIGAIQPLHTALAGRIPEATWLLLPHQDGFLSPAAAQVVKENLERPTALLFGPGFGMSESVGGFVARLIGAETGAPAARAHLPPLVIDADGLKKLAEIPGWYEYLPAPAVLTPHPGEMAVLTGLPSQEIQADRLGAAARFSQEWGHVVVLKGAFTVISAPDGRQCVIPIASPALARAGTGDVLAGLITGLRAQGVGAYRAAIAGAWIHAQAGLEAARTLGNTASVLAGDVLGACIHVLSELYQK